MIGGLLSEKYVKAARQEKWVRLWFAFFALLGSAFVVGIIFMVPSYFLLVFSKDEVSRRLASEQAVIDTLELKKTEDGITYINGMIKSFQANETERHSFSKLIIAIGNAATEGMALSSIELKSADKGLFAMVVRGKADSRENLLAYIGALKKISDFSSINSPVTNLLSSSKINFYLDITIKPESYSSYAHTQ